MIASRAEQDAIALDPPPVRAVPFVRRGEDPLPMGQGLDPPSEPELPEMPLVVGTQADPETGEIPDPWARLRGIAAGANSTGQFRSPWPDAHQGSHMTDNIDNLLLEHLKLLPGWPRSHRTQARRDRDSHRSFGAWLGWIAP